MSFVFKLDLGLSYNLKFIGRNACDQFTIIINNKELKIPIIYAIAVSRVVTEMYYNDNLARELNIQMEFKNEANEERIISILNDLESKTELVLTEMNDLIDFYKFGELLGNNNFMKPFCDFITKQENYSIDITTVFDIIELKDEMALLQMDNISFNEEITFIAENFTTLVTQEKFKKWCKDGKNYDHFEAVLRSPKLHLNSEDELVEFLIPLNSINFFEYVNLAFCSLETTKRFLEHYTSYSSNKIFISCINKRLLHNNTVEYDQEELLKRYEPCFIKKLNEANIFRLKEKIKDQEHKIKELKADLSTVKAERNSLKFPPLVQRMKSYDVDIFDAARNGNQKGLQFCIENDKKDMKLKDKEDWSLLHNAVLSKDLKTVQYLVEKWNWDVNEKNKNGTTPLYFAAEENCVPIVKYFIERCKADVHARNKEGFSILFGAAKKNSLDVIKYLWETNNADIEEKDNEGWTPLYVACANNHLETVKYLIETCGAHPENANKKGHTPLYKAVKLGNLEMVKFILSNSTERITEEIKNAAPNNEIRDLLLEYI